MSRDQIKHDRKSLTFHNETYRITSLRQLIDIIFALGFKMFSPVSAEIFMDFAQGRPFQPNTTYKRPAIHNVTNLICYQGEFKAFTFVYENTIVAHVGIKSVINNTLLDALDVQNAAYVTKINSVTPTLHYLLRVNVTPILKYRFPRNNSTYRRGDSRNFISGVNIAKYACNEFYHVIAFECCSHLDFAAATFTTAENPILRGHELAANNDYANPDSPLAQSLFAGRFIIVAQREDSAVGFIKTDLLYPLVEKCLLSASQPVHVDMPHILYSEEGQFDPSVFVAYKNLGLSKIPELRADNNTTTNSYYLKTTLNFDGDGFYRLPSDIKSILPNKILINKSFLIIYIDEKNNPVLAGVIML